MTEKKMNGVAFAAQKTAEAKARIAAKKNEKEALQAGANALTAKAKSRLSIVEVRKSERNDRVLRPVKNCPLCRDFAEQCIGAAKHCQPWGCEEMARGTLRSPT